MSSEIKLIECPFLKTAAQLNSNENIWSTVQIQIDPAIFTYDRLIHISNVINPQEGDTVCKYSFMSN